MEWTYVEGQSIIIRGCWHQPITRLQPRHHQEKLKKCPEASCAVFCSRNCLRLKDWKRNEQALYSCLKLCSRGSAYLLKNCLHGLRVPANLYSMYIFLCPSFMFCEKKGVACNLSFGPGNFRNSLCVSTMCVCSKLILSKPNLWLYCEVETMYPFIFTVHWKLLAFVNWTKVELASRVYRLSLCRRQSYTAWGVRFSAESTLSDSPEICVNIVAIFENKLHDQLSQTRAGLDVRTSGEKKYFAH